MAGGKETPRQKMVGMMYLVLTALLALNVSKSILDAFVAIEDNTQKSNIAQLERGDGFKGDVRSEITTTKGPDQAAKLEKLNKILKQMEKVDQITGDLVQKIDKLKLQVLTEAKEDVKTIKKDDEHVILWEKGEKCKPARLNLAAVQGMDKYDDPMRIIIGEDIKNPTGEGKKIWDDLIKFRSDIISAVGTYQDAGKSFSVKPTAINDFTTNADLKKKVNKMIKSSKVNYRDDGPVLEDIYINLTKLELNEVHGQKGVHWIGKTFDHSPLVAAIASLSALQQDILSARAMALAHLKSKVSTGEYSFNKIMPLAYGPMIANTGDEVELKIMMAAFDSDNQPRVTGPGSVTVADGQGTLKTKVSGGAEMVLNGTVAIKNKSGVEKQENWTHTIKIMKPQGTVSLPEMNVLYRGYDNIVEGVASGYDKTILSGSGVTLSPSAGGRYIGRCSGPGRTATITISGKNSATNKTASLGSFTFRVMGMPTPSVFFGGQSDGSTINRNVTALSASYGPDIPLNAKFTVLSWEMSVSGLQGTKKGSGSTISGEATNFLKQAKAGSMVSFLVTFIGPDKVTKKKSAVFKV